MANIWDIARSMPKPVRDVIQAPFRAFGYEPYVWDNPFTGAAPGLAKKVDNSNSGLGPSTWTPPENQDPTKLPDKNATVSDGGYAAEQVRKASELAAKAEALAGRKKWAGDRFNEMFPGEINKLQTEHDKAEAKVKGQYGDQRETLNKGFDTTNRQGMARYAAGGAGQSSAAENWFGENKGLYDKNLTKLNTGETEQLGLMETELTNAKAALERAKNNFFNDLPQFGSLEEVISYGSSLDSQIASVDEQLTNVRNKAASYGSTNANDYAGKGLMDMMEGVKKIQTQIDEGTDMGMGPEALKQWFSNFYSNPEDAEKVYQGYISGGVK